MPAMPASRFWRNSARVLPFGAVRPTPVMTMRGSFINLESEIASQLPAEGNTSLARMNVLVVGGAGYIGSHCVRQLTAAGHRPVVLDNLVYGHRAALAS